MQRHWEHPRVRWLGTNHSLMIFHTSTATRCNAPGADAQVCLMFYSPSCPRHCQTVMNDSYELI